jgi:hypothetical protein
VCWSGRTDQRGVSPGPQYSDGDPEYLIGLVGYALLALLLIMIGAHGRRRSPATLAGVKGGATASVVIAVSIGPLMQEHPTKCGRFAVGFTDRVWCPCSTRREWIHRSFTKGSNRWLTGVYIRFTEGAYSQFIGVRQRV